MVEINVHYFRKLFNKIEHGDHLYHTFFFFLENWYVSDHKKHICTICGEITFRF